MPGSSTEKNLWQIVIDALTAVPVALGLDLALKNVLKVSADKAVELARARMEAQKEIAQKRREILNDFRIMTQKDPATTNNLWRRYQEAKDALEENRFIALLGEIKATSPQGRRPTLEFLNSVDDTRFWLCLNMLEHDWFMEWFRRVRRDGERIAKKEYDDLVAWIQKKLPKLQGLARIAATQSKDVARGAVRLNDDAAGKLAGVVGKIADWLA